MKTFKERIKTYSFWTGLSASVVLLINAIAKCFGFSVDNSLVEDIIMSVCGVLVALGFVCAPKSQKNEQQTTDTTSQVSNDENVDEITDESEKDVSKE